MNSFADDFQRTGFKVRNYTLSDQIGGSVINGLAQTSDGYLWVGTNNDLQRFNGDRFVSVSELLEVAQPRVSTLLAVGETLFVGTPGRGLLRISGSEYKRFTTDNGLGDDVIWDLLADGDDALWIADSAGVSHLRGDNASTLPGLNGIASNLARDGEGQLWVSYSDGTLRQASAQGVVTHPVEGVTKLLRLPDGRVLVGTDHGLRVSNGKVGETVPVSGFPEVWVAALAPATPDEVWVASSDGELWQSENGVWRHRHLRHRLPDTAINVMWADALSGLWVGTRAGLAQISGGAVIELGPTLNETDVWAVTHDSAGQMWMASGGGGISRVDAQNARLLPLEVTLPSDEIWALAPSPQGGLWAGSGDNGAFLIEAGKLSRHVTDLPSQQVWSLLESADGTLWIGTDGGGLARFAGSRKTVFDTSNGMPGDRIWALYSTGTGVLWVGTNHGLCRLQYDTPTCFDRQQGLPSDVVWSIARADENSLWVSTDGGLAKVMLDGTIAPVLRNPLASANVFGIQYDRAGNLWALSAQGLHRVEAGDIEQLTSSAAASGPLGRSFGPADGLNQTLTSGASPPMTLDASGGLWIATHGGLILVDTAQLHDDAVRVSLRLESLEADGEKLPFRKGRIELEAGTRVLQIGFTPLSLRYPEQTLVQYRLRGVSDQWSEPTRDRVVTFSNLPAGNFLLELKIAPNSLGIVSEPAALQFRVLPYWYERNDVRLVLLLAVALLLFAAYQWRVRSMMRRYAQNEAAMLRELEVARALDDSERRVKDILANVSDLVFSADSSGTITECNAAAQGLLPGCRVGANLQDVLPESTRHNGDKASWRCEVPVNGRRSAVLDIRGTGDKDGNRLFIGRDLSDELFLQERIAAAQRIEAVGNLTAGVAHDFNNLLTVIHGNASLLAGELDNEHHLEMAAAVVDSADRAADITQKLLSIGRRQPTNPRPIDLNDYLSGQADLLRRLIRENIQLRFALSGRPVVEVDTGLLEQIILNLVVNARDAIEGSGEISIATQVLEIGEEFVASHPGIAAGRHAQLSIGDTGSGMDAHTVEHAFEPFFSTKNSATGTGLGLATVYGAVKQCGGAVYIESSPGNGTRIDVFLPATELPAANDEIAPATPVAGGNERVLVAEDDPQILAMIRDSLQSRGYRVKTASGVQQAMTVIDGDRFDLLVTDVVMADGTGPQLVETLRAQGAFLPVLYISGYSHDHLDVSRDPAFELLTKPFALEQLLTRVRRMLDRNR